MAVLIEALTVLVQKPIVEARFPGGLIEFERTVEAVCVYGDADLVCLLFMSPADVADLCNFLAEYNLEYNVDGAARDLVVVDMQRGPLLPCDWVRFGSVELHGHTVAAAWHRDSTDTTVATPEGWAFEGSLTADFGFTPFEEFGSKLVFLRMDGAYDVYWNNEINEEVFVPRRSQV